MNLQTHVRPDLWLAVSDTYQAKNYGHAILDGMHFLSSVLRDKTGVDGDGVSLVGQALGGDAPRLRVNRLQTETERNVQRGLEQLLRGLYLAIRNPRSHEQTEDTKPSADAIIMFIDYLLGILDKSEEPFTLTGFLSRVFDPDFVSSERYAQLLVDEIPANKRLDTLIEVYRERRRGDGSKLDFIVRALLNLLSDEQICGFLGVVSDELKTLQEESAIRSTLQMLPPNLWARISEVARLRIENKLIGSIREGQADPLDKQVTGALGTWARRFLPYFTLQRQAGDALLEKLKGGGRDGRKYVARFFMSDLPHVIKESSQVEGCIAAISAAIRADDYVVRRRLLNCIFDYPEDWQKAFAENLKDVTDAESPAAYLPDGTPFLKAEDELPF